MKENKELSEQELYELCCKYEDSKKFVPEKKKKINSGSYKDNAIDQEFWNDFYEKSKGLK